MARFHHGENHCPGMRAKEPIVCFTYWGRLYTFPKTLEQAASPRALFCSWFWQVHVFLPFCNLRKKSCAPFSLLKISVLTRTHMGNSKLVLKERMGTYTLAMLKFSFSPQTHWNTSLWEKWSTVIFFLRFIYLYEYTVAVFRHTRRGHQIVVSHHMVA